jgi:hypothetical protein
MRADVRGLVLKKGTAPLCRSLGDSRKRSPPDGWGWKTSRSLKLTHGLVCYWSAYKNG